MSLAEYLPVHVEGATPWGWERTSAGGYKVNNSSQSSYGLGEVQVLMSQNGET